MLFRSGRQLELVLDDPVSSVPRTLLSSNAGALTCLAYALFNTPSAFEMAKGITDAQKIVSLLTRYSREPIAPKYNAMKDITDNIVTTDKDSIAIFRDSNGDERFRVPIEDVIKKMVVRANMVISEKVVNENMLDASYFAEPYIVIQHTGNRASFPLTLGGSHHFTAVFRNNGNNSVFFGRRIGGEWYSYNPVAGVVAVPDNKAQTCIDLMCTSQHKQYYYIIYQQADRAVYPQPQQLSEYVYSEEKQNWLPASPVEPTVLGVDGISTGIPLKRCKAISRGIVNPDNRCHINSALQLIARINGIEELPEIDSDIPSFVRDLFLATAEPVRLSDMFATNTGKKASRIGDVRTAMQDDPMTSISRIFEYNDIKPFVDSEAAFTLEIATTYICSACGYKPPATSRAQTSLIIGVVHDSNVNVKLQHCIDQSLRRTNSGNTVEYTCGNCGKKGMKCSELTLLKKLSQYMLLDINIVANSIPFIEECDNFVINETRYETICMVSHRGPKEGAAIKKGGHYIAMAKRPDNRVQIYDDGNQDDGIYNTFFDAHNIPFQALINGATRQDGTNVIDPSLAQAIMASLDSINELKYMPRLILGRRLGDAA
jgi:hypothetical protein